ncbi:MAG: PQQ-dependent sugar dehydrogenase [Candidatus Geothermincolia bacterium]
MPARTLLALLLTLPLLGPALAGCGEGGDGYGLRLEEPAQEQETTAAGNTTGLPLELPQGFGISYFARGLSSPRVIEWDPDGNMVVSIRGQGRVVALPDRDGDGTADETIQVIGGLTGPHGLAFRQEGEDWKLYIAETDQLVRYDYDRENLKAENPRPVVDLPTGGGHSTRTIMFLPEPEQDRLLVSIGSSCNVCIETDDRRAKIMVTGPEGPELDDYAVGLRNSVFMTLKPGTSEVWATEMGRDFLGDDEPPDELNIIRDGNDYGWPTCYGANTHDEEFDTREYNGDPCAGKVPAQVELQAHSAPLGLAFLPQDWPEPYGGNLVVAFHGSWNRSERTGYKLVLVRLSGNGAHEGTDDFITGWLQPNGDVLGRPAGVSFHDGVLYVTDDDAGDVYRITYEP